MLRQGVVQKSLKMLNIWSFTGGSGDPSLDTQLVRLASQVIPEFLFEKDILWKQHILHYHAQVDKVCVTKGKCVHEKMFWWKYVLMKLKHIFLSTSQNFKVFDVIKIYLHLFVKCLYLFLWTVEKIYIWCLDKYFLLWSLVPGARHCLVQYFRTVCTTTKLLLLNSLLQESLHRKLAKINLVQRRHSFLAIIMFI